MLNYKKQKKKFVQGYDTAKTVYTLSEGTSSRASVPYSVGIPYPWITAYIEDMSPMSNKNQGSIQKNPKLMTICSHY